MESEHVKGTIEHARNCPEAEYEDTKLHTEAKACHLSSVSSISSSFSRASFEIDASEISPYNDPTTESKSNGNPLQHDRITSSASPPTGMTSPPIQTMAHPSGYDPNRIPSSVFSSKSVNATDWSVTSNDSLFSIHMGNGSFSRDLWKSGELSRLDEGSNSLSLCGSGRKFNELSSLPSSLPPVVEVSAHEEGSVKSSNASHVDNEGLNSRLMVAPGPTNSTLTSSSFPRLSEESGRSSRSFAFPVLVSDVGKESSLKGVEEKPEEPKLDTQDSKEPQNSSSRRCLSWCSCLPRCC